MEKNRSAKIISIVALLAAVAGLSIGFAAYSNTLTIKSEASYKGNPNDFNVDFSSSTTSMNTDNIVASVEGGDAKHAVTASDAVIDNSGNPIVKNIKVEFTAPGQSATYSFASANVGKLNAYLKSVTFNNVANANSSKVCTPSAGTSAALVSSACEKINVSVKINNNNYTGSQTGITGSLLAIDAFEPVEVTVKFDEGSYFVDGDFTVAFGDIELLYSSQD